MSQIEPSRNPPLSVGKAGQAVLRWLVALLMPVVIVIFFIRLLFFPAFLHFEYNLPGFPQDRYGFTLEDRLYWSKIAVEYLVNDADISFLGDLRFADGSPVYNERELKHMVDVKIAIQITFWVWYAALALLLAFWLWAWRGSWQDSFFQGVGRGGWLTTILLGTIILFVALSFRVFFVAFHNVFFEPGTWMFYYSDTLIRLFPERFWRDIFIYVGGLSLLVGAGLGLIFRRKKPV